MLLSLIIVLALLIRPALWAAGSFLVYDEVSASDGSHLLLLDATDVDRIVADVIHQHPDRRILILQKRPGRPMELGVLPPFDVYIRNRLEGNGVPKDSIEVIPGNGFDQMSHTMQIKGWLAAHPDAKVVGLSDQLSGRTWRKLFDRFLTPKEAEQVHLHAVARPNANSSNWWKSKLGMIFVLEQYLTFFHSGEGAER